MKNIYGIFIVLAFFADGVQAMDKPEGAECAKQNDSEVDYIDQAQRGNNKKLFRAFCSAYRDACDTLGSSAIPEKPELAKMFCKRIAGKLFAAESFEELSDWAKELGGTLASTDHAFASQNDSVKKDTKSTVLSQSSKDVAVSDPESRKEALYEVYKTAYDTSYGGQESLNSDQLKQCFADFFVTAHCTLNGVGTKGQDAFAKVAGTVLGASNYGNTWFIEKSRVDTAVQQAPAVELLPGGVQQIQLIKKTDRQSLKSAFEKAQQCNVDTRFACEEEDVRRSNQALSLSVALSISWFFPNIGMCLLDA